jgi:hypothetical protein
MSTPSSPASNPLPNPEVNERLWQAWTYKNRQLDKASAKNRLRFLQLLLLVAAVAVGVQQVAK